MNRESSSSASCDDKSSPHHTQKELKFKQDENIPCDAVNNEDQDITDTKAHPCSTAEELLRREQESSRPDPEGQENVHSTLSEVSTFVEYSARAGLTPIPVGAINPEHYANAMVPTKFLVSEIILEIENLALCRSENVAEDLKALFGFISTLIPNHWSANERFAAEQAEWTKSNKKASGVLPGGEGGAIVFDRMAETDTAYVESNASTPDGIGAIAFARKRTIVVRTNCCPAFVMSLLRSDSMLIVADWAGFHVCWDGLIAPRVWMGESELLAQKQTHNVHTVSEYLVSLREMGLCARHRHTRGLPHRPLRFRYICVHVDNHSTA